MTELPNFMDPPDKFKRLVTELETIGGKIEDDKAILFLVSVSLPSSYNMSGQDYSDIRKRYRRF